MALFDYLFDHEYRQRRDIELTRADTAGLHANISGVSFDVGDLRREVRELSALVHVLVKFMMERGDLPLADLKGRLAIELKHPQQSPIPTDAKPVTCVRCGAATMSDKAVKIGSDLWCRNCAANP